jgi:hypothetical protein
MTDLNLLSRSYILEIINSFSNSHDKPFLNQLQDYINKANSRANTANIIEQLAAKNELVSQYNPNFVGSAAELEDYYKCRLNYSVCSGYNESDEEESSVSRYVQFTLIGGSSSDDAAAQPGRMIVTYSNNYNLAEESFEKLTIRCIIPKTTSISNNMSNNELDSVVTEYSHYPLSDSPPTRVYRYNQLHQFFSNTKLPADIIFNFVNIVVSRGEMLFLSEEAQAHLNYLIRGYLHLYYAAEKPEDIDRANGSDGSEEEISEDEVALKAEMEGFVVSDDEELSQQSSNNNNTDDENGSENNKNDSRPFVKSNNKRKLEPSSSSSPSSHSSRSSSPPGNTNKKLKGSEKSKHNKIKSQKKKKKKKKHKLIVHSSEESS